MEKFDWLHFSDLHFSIKDNFDTHFAKKKLIEFIKENDIRCKYLFITGDIANRGKYDGCVDYLNLLIEALNMNSNKHNIFWAVGNHDISRENAIRNKIIDEIRTSKNCCNKFEETISTREKQQILVSIGMEDYLKHYGELLDTSIEDTIDYNTHRVIKLDDLNLIILNTCLTSCDNSDAHNLVLVDTKLSKLFDNLDKNKPTFVIAHHGKEFLHEQEVRRISNIMDGKVSLYMCGHSHRLGYSRFDDAEKDIHQLTSGGGIIDGYAKFSFMGGKFINSGFTVTPFSFSENGSQNWSADYNLHKRLKKGNYFPFISNYKCNKISSLKDLNESEKNSKNTCEEINDREQLLEKQLNFIDDAQDSKTVDRNDQIHNQIVGITKPNIINNDSVCYEFDNQFSDYCNENKIFKNTDTNLNILHFSAVICPIERNCTLYFISPIECKYHCKKSGDVIFIHIIHEYFHLEFEAKLASDQFGNIIDTIICSLQSTVTINKITNIYNSISIYRQLLFWAMGMRVKIRIDNIEDRTAELPKLSKEFSQPIEVYLNNCIKFMESLFLIEIKFGIRFGNLIRIDKCDLQNIIFINKVLNNKTISADKIQMSITEFTKLNIEKTSNLDVDIDFDEDEIVKVLNKKLILKRKELLFATELLKVKIHPPLALPLGTKKLSLYTEEKLVKYHIN
ncbi:metallophosphoesterase family protein, partial [Lacrimispora amygdalina]|uniref:metallophosphoesterase family protein n=1 Tax=Lacrimispora amygdalina TaxID=253257 RepID=UPI0031FA1284